MSKINEKRAIDLVMQLMAVRGPSCEETEIAAVVVEQLKSMGIPGDAISFDTAHKRTPRPGAIGNLIVKLPGTKKGTTFDAIGAHGCGADLYGLQTEASRRRDQVSGSSNRFGWR